MAITAKQKTLIFEQLNQGTPEEVFPLLSPERELDWLDGWTYELIFSKSGYIEKNCVFSTPHHGKRKTIWIVTQYDPLNYKLEFVRFTPKEAVVKIKISLTDNFDHTTSTLISYTYTALSRQQEAFFENELEKSFKDSMRWWEKSINHYLKTGRKLLRAESVGV